MGEREKRKQRGAREGERNSGTISNLVFYTQSTRRRERERNVVTGGKQKDTDSCVRERQRERDREREKQILR